MVSRVKRCKALFMAVLLVLTTTAPARAQEGEGQGEGDLYCTVNSSRQCVFPNQNYWSPCSSSVESGTQLLGFVAAQVCGTFHSA